MITLEWKKVSPTPTCSYAIAAVYEDRYLFQIKSRLQSKSNPLFRLTIWDRELGSPDKMGPIHPPLYSEESSSLEVLKDSSKKFIINKLN